MTIIFTDEELKWIEKEPFKWHLKSNCPKNISGELQNKIDQFYNGEHYGGYKDRERQDKRDTDRT